MSQGDDVFIRTQFVSTHVAIDNTQRRVDLAHFQKVWTQLTRHQLDDVNKYH